MQRCSWIVFLMCAAPLGFAQAPDRIMTVTRTVMQFSALENQLDDAVHAHDEAALAKLLAANFESRGAAAPGRPTPRAEWLAGLPPPKLQISQMAVHEYGTIFAVSFLDTAQHAFIVDVWTKTADGFALSVRYASPSAGAAQTQPENPAK